MRKLFLLIFSLFLIQSYSIFAADLGIGIVVPLGASISQSSITHKAGVDTKNGALSTSAGFEWGVGITPGFYKDFEDYLGFSFALDLAYHRDVFAYKESVATGSTYSTVNTSYNFDTISVGILPKLNIARFFIGLGAGIKIPLALNETTKTYNEQTQQLVDANNKYNFNDTKNKFDMFVIPYIKLTVDYLFFFNKEAAFGLGIYAGYDFGPSFKADDRFSKKSLGAFDIGAQISLYFVDN
ncbi:outer membrane beta-barrel protein [Brachyspira sp. SAP_772]|uniref:outer membrane beta-barrel protein n=1 Tax=Brachyspira sp. SAP_772 TaxID=2608385 RepID=UPI0012F4AE20|nr:outer membrane beta-barrel protein [Brachyspira sp. SAP_772]